MLVLNADSTEANLWVILVVGLLAANLGIAVLLKIKEDLAVEHTVLVKVEDLGVSTALGLLDLALLLLFLLFFVALLGQLLFPRLLHFFHLEPILLHLFLGFLEFGLSLRVEASGAATTSSLELLSELFVFLLQLTDELSRGVLVHRGLILDLLCSVGVFERG